MEPAMKLTENALAHMRNTIGKSPLGEGELRRIEPMGNLFVAIKPLAGEDEEGEIVLDNTAYWHQYTLKIDGTVYYFYGGVPVVPVPLNGA